MIGGDCSQLCRQSGAAGKRKLIRMHSQPEPVTTCRGKNLPGFIGSEYLLFTKHIAKLSKFLVGNCRKHLVDQKRDVVVAPRSILGRNTVRSEKRRHIMQRRFPV